MRQELEHELCAIRPLERALASMRRRMSRAFDVITLRCATQYQRWKSAQSYHVRFVSASL